MKHALHPEITREIPDEIYGQPVLSRLRSAEDRLPAVFVLNINRGLSQAPLKPGGDFEGLVVQGIPDPESVGSEQQISRDHSAQGRRKCRDVG